MILLSLFLVSCASTMANPINWRIVGGQDAAPGDFPFIYSLRTSINNGHICGGSILGDSWAITAAHCVDGSSASSLVIVVGTNQLNSTNAARVSISRIIIHPDWDARNTKNDVALLQLATKLTFTKLIQPIQIADTFNDSPQALTIIGWGRLSAIGIVPNDLQFLDTQGITLLDCQARWPSRVSDSQICTLTKSGEGACYGDSGGPLIGVVNGKPILNGLVSWGSPCARGLPDVFTRVSTFADWIKKTIK